MSETYGEAKIESVPTDNGGHHLVRRDEIVIRVPTRILQKVVEGAYHLGHLGVGYKVIDEKMFAQELLEVLNAEEEDGTTMIHRVFDHAIATAIDNGAIGVEESEEEDDDDDET